MDQMAYMRTIEKPKKKKGGLSRVDSPPFLFTAAGNLFLDVVAVAMVSQLDAQVTKSFDALRRIEEKCFG